MKSSLCIHKFDIYFCVLLKQSKQMAAAMWVCKIEEKYKIRGQTKEKFRQQFNPSHAAIKISINATAAEFICKNIFPTPVQGKKIK